MPAGIAFHEVIPEALAAWYDDVIVEQEGGAALDEDRLSVPVAIVDIGGRTTDFVVVKDQGVIHGSSGSLQCGMLDVKQQVANGIQERFDLEILGEQLIARRSRTRSCGCMARITTSRHWSKWRNSMSSNAFMPRLAGSWGLGVELDRILFVGGGTVALAEDIANWFPNQAIAEHPAFANARGMLKYLRYVCEASDAA